MEETGNGNSKHRVDNERHFWYLAYLSLERGILNLRLFWCHILTAKPISPGGNQLGLVIAFVRQYLMLMHFNLHGL